MGCCSNFHDNMVTESFFQLLKHEQINKKIHRTQDEASCDILIVSKCFITVTVGMVQVIRCHQLNMKISIINNSEVSRLSVAIHIQTS